MLSDELDNKLESRIENKLAQKSKRKRTFDGFKKNILVMDFIGKNGVPTKTLLQSQVDQQDYESAISLIRRLYKEAKLVHGDFSEYNIFKTENGLLLFDLGSAVDLRHPNANEFLKRDINNITKFFVKRGLTVANPVDVLLKVTK